MSSKQDRVAPRTVADIERKYNFGKSFAEVMGIVDDARDEVDSAYSELKDEITEQFTAIRRDTEKIVIEAVQSIDRVETKTGYVFDSEGLKINKTGEEMSNLLDNTGMYVRRGIENILTANNEGVTAADLHARTYLKIGSGGGRCRFEDYGYNRIGCFWIGG